MKRSHQEISPLKHALVNGRVEAGCDEVGRGCLAGPVVAAAVILPEDFNPEGIIDSKKLNLSQRLTAAERIKKEAEAYAIVEVSPERIDEINILNASFEAMAKAVLALEKKPEHLLIDGNRFRSNIIEIPFTCIVKGDGKFLSIAAASILAKTHRDDLMLTLHDEEPQYAWNTNVGYPTVKHREALKKYGISKWHRKSFNLWGNGEQKKFFG